VCPFRNENVWRRKNQRSIAKEASENTQHAISRIVLKVQEIFALSSARLTTTK